ncbi:MAG: hypothetical protein VB961_00245, partial [Dehalococcoidia bacterium]
AEHAITKKNAIQYIIPLIIRSTDTTRHLIIGDNGFPFSRRNSSELASALLLVLSDEDRRNSMSENSRLLAENVFDWKVVAKRTNQVYEEILQGTDEHIQPIWDSRFSSVE